MAFNQFMHPRNHYRQKPDYQRMAEEYPEFSRHITYDQRGKPSIDYTKIEALRSLTKTLLQKDFNLDIEIPDDRLVPTLPMRLNYILWIEDLLKHCGIDQNVITGLDIGTGCCAIFPLLACTLNPGWRFIATDIDAKNLQYANENIIRNNLANVIKIIPQEKSDRIFKNILEKFPGEKINFIMTNPPFFEDTFNDEDSFDNGNDDGDHPRKTFHTKKTNTASANEAICDGGEFKFIKTIAEESFETKDQIDLYTVMIGRKKTFLELKTWFKELRENNQIADFGHTELCQGNTKRWALAWTFNRRFNLSQAPRITSCKSKPLIHYIPQETQVCQYQIKEVADYIKHLLVNDLNIETFTVREMQKSIEFDIMSNECTWRNQRKKRREKQFLEQQQMEMNIEQNDSLKRNAEQLEPETSTSGVKRRKETEGLCKKDLTILLHCGLVVKRDKQDIFLKMITKEMSQNKNTTFELFQYFRNRFS